MMHSARTSMIPPPLTPYPLSGLVYFTQGENEMTEESVPKSAAEMSLGELLDEQIDALRTAVRESPAVTLLTHGVPASKQIFELASIREGLRKGSG